MWAQEEAFCGSAQQTDTVKVPREFMERLTDAVCYAACMAIVHLRIYRQFIQNSSPDVTLATPVDESEEDLLTVKQRWSLAGARIQ